MSDDGGVSEPEEMGADGAERTLDFGWEDAKPLSGRRAAKERAQRRKVKAGSFETMSLSPLVLKGIKRKGYQLPTPIQRKAMPAILAGQDVVGMARTGSGKTAAFVIPLVEKLRAHSTKAGARAVILSPTRELALQTAKVVRELGRFTSLRSAILVGGDSMEAQFAELAANPDVIIATPGRLMHHLQEIEGMSLAAVEYCVFDEADRLFEMGFAEQLRAILHRLGPARQTLLFSATLPSALAEFARAGLREPEFVRLDADAKLSPDLSLAFFTVRKEDKAGALVWLLREFVREGEPTIVFTATRHHVEFLHALLKAAGIHAACVYGAMDQAARRIHIGKFTAGRCHVLVTTDVAARGLDIPLLDNVVNYDFPAKPKLFVHRAGRAARAGRRGAALSLLTREELPFCLDLHLFLSRPLQPAPIASLGQAAAAAADLDASSSLYGCFPQAALEDAVAEAQSLVAEADLAGLQRSVGNAWALYCKTRPPASAESVGRAKGLPREGIHPLLARAMPATRLAGLEAQEALRDISRQLTRFRPSATVLEAEVAPARRGEGAGGLAGPGLTAASGPDALQEVMRAKRRTHDATILAARTEAAEAAAAGPSAGSEAAARSAAAAAAVEGDGPGGRFRDEAFFLGAQQSGQRRFEEEELSVAGGSAAQMAGAVLDLTADDSAGMAQQSRQYHWDKRKRRYIQLQPGEQLRGGKRQKQGVAGEGSGRPGGKPAEPGKLYKRWAKAHATRIAAVGQAEDREAAKLGSGVADRFKYGGRGWTNPMKQAKGEEGRGPRSELKGLEQVRKARKVKERRAERIKASKKGAKGGKPAAAGKKGRNSGGVSTKKGPPPAQGGVRKGGFKKGAAGGRKGAAGGKRGR